MGYGRYPLYVGKRGRKSGFNRKIKATILRLLKEGKTEAQVAHIIGVSRKTIYNWKGAHAELLHAVREGKLVADELVEAALFSRATGYSHPELKVFCSPHFGIVRERVTKHYAPDTTAAMFWLRNRQPERWREKTEGDVTVNTNVIGSLPDEQLDARIAKFLETLKAPKDPETP